MSAPVTKHTARLRQLEKARPKVAALPRGVLLTSDPMAKTLGVNWKTLRDWCNDLDGFEESGAFERGSNGLKYEFCPVRTLWFLIEHFRAQSEAEVAKADRVNAMVLGPEVEAPSGLDLDDMRKILDLQDRLLATRNRAGDLTDAKVVGTALNKVFSRMQEVALTAPQELDPAGQWSPEVRGRIDLAMQHMLLRQRAAARETLAELRLGTD